CSGHSLLGNGDLYITGGNDYDCEFQGRADTHTFNPFRTDAPWTRLEDMSVGRWYPTSLTIGDGRVLILSGLDRTCEVTPVMEMYTPGVGLEVVPEGERFVSLYPRLHLLTTGKMAHVGPENVTYTFDPELRLWQFIDFTNFGWRSQGTSVMVPGEIDEVMIVGGYTNKHANGTCERIDFKEGSPQWRPTGSLNFARAHANAVILPDRNIMLVGGGTGGFYDDPIFSAEMYDPDTESWTVLPPNQYGRMYHSTAVLLPDGRVLSAGQNSGKSGEWAEIYEPAYLFRGPRPIITDVPERISYGKMFSIATPQAGEITAVVLMGLSTVTHSVNNTQRYVGLNFFTAVDDHELIALGPPNGNHAPVGFYMLFILNASEVPSNAKIVRVGPPGVGDYDGDGDLDLFDFEKYLECIGGPAGGINPGCDAFDMDDDADVDFADAGRFFLDFTGSFKR
ncbi:MAG: DUF1929 domain-containing protein, partial [Planctomycetes bacterium]|nr:DUF1929 domain-containing protein [Planctomycetota bacterium]